MFKLIKLTFILGLIMGVVFLGVKIANKSSEMELDLAEKKSAVQEKITELKKEALKKTVALGKVYKDINDSFEKGKAKQTRNQTHRDYRKDDNRPFVSSTETRKPAVSLKPLDEEDRKLTAEILAEVEQNKQPSKEALKISEMYNESSISAEVIQEQEPAEPVDLNRVAEIRDIYAKAIETLDSW